MSLLSVSCTDAPLGKFHADIAVGLADEGVPIAAIGRAIKQNSEMVRRAVHEAFYDGRITEIPRDDWPLGSRRAEHQPTEASLGSITDRHHLAARRVFKLTNQQARVFVALATRAEVRREVLREIARPPHRRSPDQQSDNSAAGLKLIDVLVHRIREALIPFKLEIKTIWSGGYFMEPAHRRIAMNYLNGTLKPNEDTHGTQAQEAPSAGDQQTGAAASEPGAAGTTGPDDGS